MKNKLHLKKYKKKKGKNLVYLILIIIFIIIGLLIKYIGTKTLPILIEYATTETKKIVTIVINKAVSKQLTTSMNTNDLFTTIKDKEGNIISVDYNPIVVNKILNVTTSLIQLNLKAIEDGDIDMLELSDVNSNLKNGVIYKIPLGIVTSNPLLSNLGPKIPVKINLTGAVEGNLETKITNYGINAAVIEVSINIRITGNVILPFITNETIIENNIPIAIKLVQGSVPKYYSNGLSSNSPLLSLPIE